MANQRHIDKATATVKGMYQDVSKNNQPENTYSFALNAVKTSEEGEDGFLVNEKGNSVEYTLDSGFKLIGHYTLPDNEVILFSVNTSTGISEIGLQNKLNNYSTIIKSDCLGFTLENQVQATLNYVNKCERVITFRAPKLYQVNIDSLTKYLLPGYGIVDANATAAGWDCDQMKLFSPFDYACVDDVEVLNTGGILKMGAYEFTATYLDESLNEAGWMGFSMPAPVVDDSLTAGFNQIDGGTHNIGPETSKSIRISFSNIDQSYEYLRLAVVATIDGIRTSYRVAEIPIAGTTLEYTLTQTETLPIIDLESLTVSKAIYDTAQTVSQKDNRILIGNLTEKNVDLSKFQQAANDIQTRWVAKEVIPEDVGGSHVKSPDYYQDNRSYMTDEVYMIGIEYLFKDGYRTPIMHIPGREKDKDYLGTGLIPAGEYNLWHNRPVATSGWDSSVYTLGTAALPYEEAKHIIPSGMLERWQIANTAVRDTTAITGYHASGELAYWESELAYPNDTDSDGNRIYPTGNIRHLKMPDFTLISTIDWDAVNTQTKTYPLGLDFYNIQIPAEYADEVVGYKIHRVKRTSTTSSVIDKGMFTRMLASNASALASGDIDEPIVFQPFPYQSTRSTGLFADNATYFNAFHGAKVKFDQTGITPSFIKMDQVIKNRAFTSGDLINYSASSTPDFRSYMRVSGIDSSPSVPSFTNRKLLRSAFVDPDTNLSNVFSKLVNNLEQQELYLLEFEDPVPNPGTNLDGLVSTDTVEFHYGGLKQYLPSQYGNLYDVVYIPCDDCYIDSATSSIVMYGGDTFISPIYFRRSARMVNGGGYFYPVNHTTAATYRERHIIKFYTESTINTALRHEGLESAEVYYPKSYEGDFDSFANLEATLGSTDDDLLPNYYAYNTDYSKEPDNQVAFPVQLNYDWKGTCTNKYTRRVAYSERQNEESTIASVKQFLVNNYRDLDGIKGDIVNIFSDKDKLYIQSKGGLWLLPTNEQVIQTDQAAVYVGNSGFMSLDPVSLSSLVDGYTGSKAQWATTLTEFGTFIVSNDKLFMLGEGLQEVSVIGLKEFFIKNKLTYPQNLLEFLEDNGLTPDYEFPNYDNPANPNGVGYIGVWDRDNERYILTKRDFKILIEKSDFWGIYNSAISYTVGSIVYDLDLHKFKRLDPDGWELIEFTDSNYFQNLSYTLSFDAREKSWISFHSYLPNYMYNTYDRWFTYIHSSNTVYRQDVDNFQEYYGVIYPHIIELVIPSHQFVSSVSKSLAYISQAKQYNDTYEEWVDNRLKTFDKVWLYNDHQSSGYLDVDVINSSSDPFQSINYSPTTIQAFKADKTWQLSAKRNIFNNTLNIPISTKRWSDIGIEYFIDKIPNADAHDATIDQFELAKLRDKYLAIRLKLDSPDNNQIATQFVVSKSKMAIR